MNIDMEFIADSVPAILVLGGFLLIILGFGGGGGLLALLGVMCLVGGVCVYLLKERIIRI